MSGEMAPAHPQAITLEALEASFDQLLPGALAGPAKDFLRQAWEDYAADETPELDGRDMAGLLALAWRGAEGRAHGEPYADEDEAAALRSRDNPPQPKGG